MFVTVSGIQGSGKTFLCNELNKNDITCVDIDDYYKLAYDTLKNKNPTYKKIDNLAIKLLTDDVKKIKRLVIVGVYVANIKNFTPLKKYVIKISNKELELIYKRTIVRELLKIKSLVNDDLIKDIDTMKINDIQYYFTYHFMLGINPFTETFESYKEKYNKSIICSGNDVVAVGQKQIFKHILYLFDDS